MSDSYFLELREKTGSRFWINNPTLDEVGRAISQRAYACTTNPAYCSKLLKNDPAALRGMIDEYLLAFDFSTRPFGFDEAAQEIYRRAAKRLMEAFLPLYQRSGGAEGFVTVQDNPTYDEDAEHLIASIDRNRQLSENYMAKIPVIPSGMKAIYACVERNIPICATEVFTIAQARTVCELYRNAVSKTGNRPPMFVTHITGIFDEYLEKRTKRLGIEVSAEALAIAGTAVARKQYRMMREAGDPVTMLGGGARKITHLTELIGGPHVTINWSTVSEVLQSGDRVRETISLPVDERLIGELIEKVPDFRRAYEEDGLAQEEFANYGPVQLFRNSFLNGWYVLQAEIAARRNQLAI